VVEFETRAEDFPPNLTDVTIDHVVVYLVRAEGASFEIAFPSITFVKQGTSASIGGAATTLNGIISTRRGALTSFIGAKPPGRWRMQLPTDVATRARFTNREILDIGVVITFGAQTATWV
jgi:hypothetical protein